MNLIPILPMVLQEAAKRSTADEGAVLLVFGAVCGLFAAAIWIRAAVLRRMDKARRAGKGEA